MARHHCAGDSNGGLILSRSPSMSRDAPHPEAASSPEDTASVAYAPIGEFIDVQLCGAAVQTPARVNVTCVTPLGEEVASTW